jgi:hypothetical protein
MVESKGLTRAFGEVSCGKLAVFGGLSGEEQPACGAVADWERCILIFHVNVPEVVDMNGLIKRLVS